MSPAFWAVKTSMLVFYIRVFGNVKWLRMLCYVLIALAVPFYWSNVILPFIFCIPWNTGHWDSLLLASCAKMAPSTVVIGCFSVALDAALFLIPLPVLSGLKLGRAHRKALIPVFLAGFL